MNKSGGKRKTRKLRRGARKYTRKSQRGGQKKMFTRQLGQRNVLNPVKPREKKFGFSNDVKVHEFEINKNAELHPVGNSSKTKTKKAIVGTPEPNPYSRYYESIAHDYAKIHEKYNTPQEILGEIKQRHPTYKQDLREMMTHEFSNENFEDFSTE
jgi:hypothetical protein